MLMSTQNIVFNGQSYQEKSLGRLQVPKINFNRIFQIIVTFLDYILAMILGGLGGGCMGWIIGSLYQELFEPAYLSTFKEIEFWYYLPQVFGQYGAVAIALMSLPCYIFISSKRLNRQISDFYQKGMTKPYDLHKFTGASLRRIEKVVGRLAQEQTLV